MCHLRSLAMMLERMSENDAIVTRYISDRAFQDTAFPILAREVFDAVNEDASAE